MASLSVAASKGQSRSPWKLESSVNFHNFTLSELCCLPGSRNIYFKHNEQEEENSVFGSPIHNRPPPALIETLDLKLLLKLMMFLLSISTLVR